MAVDLVVVGDSGYVTGLVKKNRLLCILFVVGVGVGICFLGVGLSLKINPPLLVIGALVFGVSYFFARKYYRAWKRASIGIKTERRVSAALCTLDTAVVLQGMLLGAGGDVDHVLLGPFVVAVETKTGGGRVSYTNHVLRAGDRNIPKDPVAQARRQATQLGRLTNRRACGIVCVADMSNKPFVVGGDIWVCGLKDLLAVIARQERTLTKEQALVLGKQIVQSQGQRRRDSLRR